MHFISIRALLVTFVQMRVPGIPPNPRRSTFELKLKAGERSLFLAHFENNNFMKKSLSGEVLVELRRKSHGIKSKP